MSDVLKIAICSGAVILVAALWSAIEGWRRLWRLEDRLHNLDGLYYWSDVPGHDALGRRSKPRSAGNAGPGGRRGNRNEPGHGSVTDIRSSLKERILLALWAI